MKGDPSMRIRWCLACATIAAATSTLPAQSHFIEVQGARIHYTVVGSGPAVVLVHGWALDLREWTDQVAALSPRYRVIAIDRRGFGKSTGAADVSADPGDVRALLDTLGIHSAVLVGHSAGAMVAQRFAAALPSRVEALVLYGGPTPTGLRDEQSRQNAADEAIARAEIARRHGVDSVMREMLSHPQFLPGANRSRATAARLDSILKEYSGQDLLDPRPQSGAFPGVTPAQMRSFRFPVLFISGENEARPWQVGSDSLVRWMPDARKVIVPGGGHGVHFDEPQRFNQALLAFLDSVTRRATRSPDRPSWRGAPDRTRR
jgi:3-oxoadipate enol-lactonase